MSPFLGSTALARQEEPLLARRVRDLLIYNKIQHQMSLNQIVADDSDDDSMDTSSSSSSLSSTSDEMDSDHSEDGRVVRSARLGDSHRLHRNPGEETIDAYFDAAIPEALNRWIEARNKVLLPFEISVIEFERNDESGNWNEK